MKVLFLDIDGVLNGNHFWHEKNIYAIDPKCMERLNEIIWQTGAAIVVSSSWRYLVLNGDMTPAGFGYMLRTHGLTSQAKVIGVTREDADSDDDLRSTQIRDWMKVSEELIQSYVVIDDLPLQGFGSRFIQTDSVVGLTDENAEQAIAILGKEKT